MEPSSPPLRAGAQRRAEARGRPRRRAAWTLSRAMAREPRDGASGGSAICCAQTAKRRPLGRETGVAAHGQPRSAARRGLGSAEDARRALLLLLLLALLTVGRDDDALARRQLTTVEAGLDLLGVERLALEQRVREAVELVAVLFQ